MENLPLDLTIDILSRLPIKSLIKFRCVSKLWCKITQNPRLLRMQFYNSLHNKNPNLILHCTYLTDLTRYESDLYFVENDETHDYSSANIKIPIPNFNDYRIMGSCHGLLLLFHSMDINEAYVCNPFVGDYVKLPNPITALPRPRNVVVGFGFSAEMNDYKVVVIVYYPGLLVTDDMISRVYACGLSDCNWRFLGESPYLVFDQSASKAVVNGIAHWVTFCPNKLIVSFDLGYDKFGIVSRPEIGLEGGSFSLGVLGGSLSVTDSSPIDCVGIWVMKEYGVKESWTKCFSIKFSDVGWNIRYIWALCFQNNDELLLLYNNQSLFSYNVVTTRFKKISIRGLPHWFDVVPHAASLVSLLRNASGEQKCHELGIQEDE